MMKKCSLCKTEHPLSEYNKNATTKDGLQSVCRECNRARSRRYYAENPDKHKAAVLARSRTQRVVLRTILIEHKAKPCMDCGESYPYYVMDFDHVRGVKAHNISKMVSHRDSVKALLEEIAKCDLVCSNCHRVRTFTRGQAELVVE